VLMRPGCAPQRDKAEATIRRACDELRASVAKREETLLTRLRVLDTESQGRLRKCVPETHTPPDSAMRRRE
jgi:hypothetical protein